MDPPFAPGSARPAPSLNAVFAQSGGGRRLIVVDIAGMAIASDPQEVLITYSLGSCLGVAIYDPALKLGGMIHCMLPLSRIDPSKAYEKPCMFVDTGVPLLLTRLFELGAKKSRLVIYMAGASQVMEKSGFFRIGERNVAILRKILWKNSLFVEAEDVGGDGSRTIGLEIETGRFLVRSGSEIRELRTQHKRG
jgi:chemotaxis protein CheD